MKIATSLSLLVILNKSGSVQTQCAVNDFLAQCTFISGHFASVVMSTADSRYFFCSYCCDFHCFTTFNNIKGLGYKTLTWG